MSVQPARKADVPGFGVLGRSRMATFERTRLNGIKKKKTTYSKEADRLYICLCRQAKMEIPA